MRVIKNIKPTIFNVCMSGCKINCFLSEEFILCAQQPSAFAFSASDWVSFRILFSSYCLVKISIIYPHKIAINSFIPTIGIIKYALFG